MTLGSKEQNFVLTTTWRMQKDKVLRSVSKYLPPKTKATQPGNKIVPCREVGWVGTCVQEVLVLLL